MVRTAGGPQEGPDPSQHGDTEMPTTPTIVLVHGAWADASSWTGVIQRLHAAGHDVVALPNTLRGVAADAAVIRNYLDAIDGPIVLVAHSYGGFVITNAATGAQNVKALVYVDAFIPDEGQPAVALAGQASALAAAGTDPTSALQARPDPRRAAGGRRHLPPAEHGQGELRPGRLGRGRGADLRDPAAGLVCRARRAVRSARLEGHPVLGDHREAGQDHRPRLPARDGRACRREITEIDASHVSMVSHPDAVVEVIEQALREVGELQPA